MFRNPTAGRRRWTLALTAVATLACGIASAQAAGVPIADVNPFGTDHVGQQADSRILLPTNQYVQPAGQRITLSSDVAGATLSPDGSHLAVQVGGSSDGAKSLDLVDAATGAVVQRFGGSGISAPYYSPDGTALYATQSGSILKYAVGADGLVTDPTSPTTITLPQGSFTPTNGAGMIDGGGVPAGSALPLGMASSADGSTLYVAENGSNALAVVDTATDKVTDQIPVGNVPADVVVADGKAYVSDRGGAIAAKGQATNDSGGAAIVIDKATNAPASGTVSVVDLATDKVVKTIDVGLQPAAMTVHDGAVFVADTASDTVSVIDTAQDRVAQTFNVQPLPGSSVGAAPNSITFAGHQLLVSVGRDNAIAEFGYTSPTSPVAYQGLIPTDGYPNDVAYDAKVGKVFVSNQVGIGTDGAIQTHADQGTVTDFAPPTNAALGTMTHQVFADNGWDKLTAPHGKALGHVAPAPVPAQLGQPSPIKHVILIDRENRTYDQVLGDIGKGNSDPEYANFGEKVTPNAHAISNTFTLFDNFYDNGMLSADGHNWLLQADNNDYLEQDAATAWARSYPDLGGDELQNQTGGSLWNAAERAGLTVENYGEQQDYTTGQFGTWQQYYADSQIMEGKATGPRQAPPLYDTEGDNASLNAITDHSYPGWNLALPDQYRVDIWEKSFKKDEQTGKMPNLTILYLPNDHTGGNGTGQTPEAQVADNDLATGRVFSDVSHSKFWKSSAIFTVEDDSQAGNDHVDGHRAPLLAASPYLKRGAIDSSYYSQINVTKTIEQILGIQPMNQMDRAAVPMFDAFTDKPDFTPYDAVPNQTPITQGVNDLIPLTPSASDSAATAASVSATSGPAAPAVPAAERSTASAWASWSRSVQPQLVGPRSRPDMVNPAELNRYDWYTSTGWTRPYPGDKTILAPDQVPGRNLPSDFLGD